MTALNSFDIEGQNVIVTGGAMGIGLGIARRFVEGGANVLLVDRDENAVRIAADGLKGKGRSAWLAVDIGADDAGAQAVAKCVASFGSVTTLVNNAGIFPQVPMLEISPDVFDRVYRTNLRGLAFMSAAVGKQLVAQKTQGSIINIGSVDSVHPSMIGLAAYDASKGGVLMFTRSFALEMAVHGVRVNAVLPGGVTTEGTSRPLAGSKMTAEQMKEMMDHFTQTKIPMRRMGVPDDISGAVIFLASSAASYMTGASIVVDGGMLLA
ncbi:MAG: SDR family oxidoreductase [Sandaracinaceae bacterium]|nr:SDR family oxidoreductase [Sandaracinaceae bacterium]